MGRSVFLLPTDPRNVSGVNFAYPVTDVITWALSVVSIVLGLWALLDVARRPAASFAAAERQTKTVWLAICAGSAFVLSLYLIFQAVPPQQLLWLVAMVGVLVYLIDVRPRLKDINNGSRW